MYVSVIFGIWKYKLFCCKKYQFILLIFVETTLWLLTFYILYLWMFVDSYNQVLGKVLYIFYFFFLCINKGNIVMPRICIMSLWPSLLSFFFSFKINILEWFLEVFLKYWTSHSLPCYSYTFFFYSCSFSSSFYNLCSTLQFKMWLNKNYLNVAQTVNPLSH